MTTLPEEAVTSADIIQVITDLRLAILQDDDEGLAEHAEPMIKAKELIAKLSASPFLPVQGAVKVKPLDWTEDSAPGYRLFSAQSDIGHFAYGTDADGNPWSSSPLGIKDHANEEAAKRAAEKAHYGLVVDQAKAIGLEVSALEPSAARELALEEHLHAIEQQLAVNLGYFHDEKRFLLETLQAHITTRIAAIRVLSSPDHADAGKVEGDVEKWSIREIVAKAIAYHSVGDPHAKTIRGDQRWEWFVEEADKFISVFGYYLPALPSAPSQEVA